MKHFSEETYSKWINVNSANIPDKLSTGSFMLWDYSDVGCMAIAFLSMEGFDKKKETQASLDLLDTIGELVDSDLATSNFMFFWTDVKTEIDFHKKEMGITWDDVPSIGAKCKNESYAYPKGNPLTTSAINGWLAIISMKNLGFGKDPDSMKEVMDQAMHESSRTGEAGEAEKAEEAEEVEHSEL